MEGFHAPGFDPYSLASCIGKWVTSGLGHVAGEYISSGLR